MIWLLGWVAGSAVLAPLVGRFIKAGRGLGEFVCPCEDGHA